MGSSGAVENAMVECACDRIARSPEELSMFRIVKPTIRSACYSIVRSREGLQAVF